MRVTPYAGVWIEMSVSVSLTVKYLVTPYVGVWIEIQYIRRGRWIYVSLPTRECGLKLKPTAQHRLLKMVIPYAGVWIEI